MRKEDDSLPIPRLWIDDAIYHITNRGARKEPIFFNNIDKYRFLLILTEAHHKYQFKLHAYCLMNNHFHLLIQSAEHSPSKIMQTILQRYSRYFNRTYQTQGHVFQDRFYAAHVDQQDYFLNVSKYIHLNPVVAGMVVKPEDYQWSSYNSYTKNSHRNHPFIDTTMTYSCYQHNPREMYRKFVEK